MAANGSVIKHTKNKTYILTAAHLIWLNPLSTIRKLMIYRPGAKVKIVTSYSAVDFVGNLYMGLKLVSYNKNTDLAIMKLKRIKLSIIEIAKKAPKVGDMLYNVSTPAGMYRPGMIPFFKGQFLGYSNTNPQKKRLAITSIPTAKGASGSPIVNSNGRLVGMISAVHRRFHHISFSPTHSQIVKFIKKTFKEKKAYMCLRKGPTSRPTSRPSNYDSP
jgi:S1-C subfamily serine protease